MHARLRQAIALLTISAAITLGSSLAASAATEGPVRSKMALGVSMMPYTDISRVEDFREQTGRYPAIWSVWSSWGGWSGGFSSTGSLNILGLLQALDARGITPMIIWEPAESPPSPSQNPYTYPRINAGDHDRYIRRYARALRDSGIKVLLRAFHEMNGGFLPWSYNRFNNSVTGFKNAWKRVWNIYKGPNGVGATNVKFLFSPNEPCGRCATIQSVWPGNKFVDYVGFSAFNWGGDRGWKSMIKKYTPSMTILASLTSKPVIVTETGSSADGGNKAAWISTGYQAAYTKWPRLKGIVYFNIKHSDHPDWRLTEPNLAPLEAYTALLTDPRFQGRMFQP